MKNNPRWQKFQLTGLVNGIDWSGGRPPFKGVTVTTLPKTKIAPENRPGPKRKGSSPNHPFSDVSFREGWWWNQPILKHMRKSNWIISPSFGVKIPQKMPWKPPVMYLWIAGFFLANRFIKRHLTSWQLEYIPPISFIFFSNTSRVIRRNKIYIKKVSQKNESPNFIQERMPPPKKKSSIPKHPLHASLGGG